MPQTSEHSALFTVHPLGHFLGITLTISVHSGECDLDSRPRYSESQKAGLAPEEQRREKLSSAIRIRRIGKGSLYLSINTINYFIYIYIYIYKSNYIYKI